MQEFLFNDFNPVSAKEWKQKIQFDLKGADYNETLVTKTNEDITINPFYHKDSYKSLKISKPNQDTLVCQTVFIASEKIANNIAKDALLKGVKCIRFIANTTFDIDILFANLDIQKFSFIIELNFINQDFYKQLITYIKNKNIQLFIDCIGKLNKTGNWFTNQKIDFNFLKNIQICSIDASIYQNAGANITQQIAYTLAHITEYFNAEITPKEIQVKFSVSANFFFEIAKLRAFRYLFKKLSDEFEITCSLNLIVIPSKRNKTIYDYNVNMLRTTTECMSAMLGGASVICNLAYDNLYHKSNEFGERIARNQLLILKEESYFTEASKITEGSYYIEQITQQLAEKSLALFKEIEKNGGYLSQIKKGSIQRKIKEAATKEQAQFDAEEIVLLGTNKYPNPEDKIKHELELYPFQKKRSIKTIIEPILEKRLAEKIEQERLKNE